jgi:enoyl-CoA hydratase
VSTRDELRIVRDGQIATLVIDRPERRNALSSGVSQRIVDALVELDEDPDVRAIAVTGAGTAAFSAGADLWEHDDRARASGRGPRHPLRGAVRHVVEAVLECGRPTLAIVNGPAMGGGFELALACDLRIAAPHARFALPEIQRGVGATFGSVLLPRVIPRAIALELLYTGRAMEADEALRWGLVNRVADSADLEAVARELLDLVTAGAPLTAARYKRMTTQGWDLPPAAALRLDAGPDPYRSEDAIEGVRAFREHRAPRWSGR